MLVGDGACCWATVATSGHVVRRRKLSGPKPHFERPQLGKSTLILAPLDCGVFCSISGSDAKKTTAFETEGRRYRSSFLNIWEFPKIRGPKIDSQDGRDLIMRRPKRYIRSTIISPIYGSSHLRNMSTPPSAERGANPGEGRLWPLLL